MHNKEFAKMIMLYFDETLCNHNGGRGEGQYPGMGHAKLEYALSVMDGLSRMELSLVASSAVLAVENVGGFSGGDDSIEWVLLEEFDRIMNERIDGHVK